MRQARFSPAVDQVFGRPFSVETPVRAGPRHSGQSEAVRTAEADTSVAAAAHAPTPCRNLGFIDPSKNISPYRGPRNASTGPHAEVLVPSCQRNWLSRLYFIHAPVIIRFVCSDALAGRHGFPDG